MLAAESVVVSNEVQMIHFSDGSELKVEVSEETVCITGTHVKSQSRYSYVTAGYNISLEKTGGMVEQKDFKTIDLLDKQEIITDKVTTTYVLSRESIYEAAFELFRKQNRGYSREEQSEQFLRKLYEGEGLDFYLHNAFRVIERKGGSGSEIISESDIYHSLGTLGETPEIPGILNAIETIYGLEWSNATKAKLAEYYDIHLKLFMEPCHASIMLVTEDGQVLEKLEEGYPVVQYARMEYRLPVSCYDVYSVDGKDYQLTESSILKSYVSYGLTGTIVQHCEMGNKNRLSADLGTRRISYRQLLPEDSYVYLVCEEISRETKAPEDEIEESCQYITIDCFAPVSEVKIGAEEFDPVESGIPVNEELSVTGQASGYLIKAEFVLHEGMWKLWIPVEKTYELRWKESTEETEFCTDMVYKKTVREYVPLERRYSYITIEEMDCYMLEAIRVENAALPDNGVLEMKNLMLSEGENTLLYQQYGGIDGHIVLPEQIKSGICLPEEIIYGEYEMPEVPKEDFAAEIEGMIEELMVRDDKLCLYGSSYLDSEWQSQGMWGLEERKERLLSLQEQSICTEIKADGLRIPKIVANGLHPGNAEVIYRREISTSGKYPKELVFPVEAVDGVIVHTPVYCSGILESDNKTYCQQIAPDKGAESLVLDAEGISSDFFVHISNYGAHSEKKGYGIRDYSVAFSAPDCSYIAEKDGKLRNEVCFPFDVFYDCEADYDNENDRLYPAGEWIVLGKERLRFYLPEWVEEGIYDVCYRTIAVNGEEELEHTEPEANRTQSNYVAVSRSRVEVSGKMYGFQIYDIADYPVWESVFRDADGQLCWNGYKAGVCDEYGRTLGISGQKALPLIRGSHPSDKTACIKPGYLFRFCIDTIGKRMQEEDGYIRITPKFYHIDRDGNNRKEVELYYCRRMPDGREYLVKIGSDTDAKYSVQEQTGNVWLGIPKAELAATAQRKQIGLEEYTQQWAGMYSYAGMEGKSSFKTDCNFSYTEAMMALPEWEELQKTGISCGELNALRQRHYFEYALPCDVMAAVRGVPVEEYAAKKGISFLEDFWIKEGYLIVQFEITAYAGGAAYLSYANNENRSEGYCCMWSKEHMPSEKMDGMGVLLYFEPGDIFGFPIGQSIKQDYSQGGIY